MGLYYDDVVPKLIEVCESLPESSLKRQFLLVQTLNGRVRLVLQGVDQEMHSVISKATATALGDWFQGPVISSEVGSPGLTRLAKHLWHDVDERRGTLPEWSRRWPEGWPTEYRPLGEAARSLEGRWEALQVTAGKDPWLRLSPAAPPRPMMDPAPRITAFYGFKGGVGRTTTLAILAWRLARAGRRVVCVDLDLEAPGLGTALVQGTLPPNLSGVIDALLTHAVTGEGLSPPPLIPVNIHNVEGLSLVHAGHLTTTYVEKLARLDLVHREQGPSPVHQALTEFLKVIRKEARPDHIFLDCRSGLHDLAGLALHDLAHVDVLVGRGDRQEMEGLRVLLPPLLRRRAERDQRILFLRTFHPAPIDRDLVSSQREAPHTTLADLLYKDNPPAVDAEEQAHDPCPIAALDEIARASWIGAVSESTLGHETFNGALSRLEALWHAEDAS